MKQAILICFINLVFLSSCATIQDFFGFGPTEIKEEAPKIVEAPKVQLTKYSDEPNHEPDMIRSYKRMTKDRMEEESELQAGAGSLWVMEGQNSYLFAQNKHRQEGDPSKVKVEGSGLKLVQLKVSTIQDLLIELEKQKQLDELKKKQDEYNKKRTNEINIEKKAILNKNEVDNEEDALLLAEKRISERMPASILDDPNNVKIKEEVVDLKDLSAMPVKIVEKLPEGQYRVTGEQAISIRNKAYKVITTGLVRFEDFNDDLISSERMYQPQFDVVHVKK